MVDLGISLHTYCGSKKGLQSCTLSNNHLSWYHQGKRCKFLSISYHGTNDIHSTKTSVVQVIAMAYLNVTSDSHGKSIVQVKSTAYLMYKWYPWHIYGTRDVYGTSDIHGILVVGHWLPSEWWDKKSWMKPSWYTRRYMGDSLIWKRMFS